jgi:HD-like signal output (HDOD) protein
MRFFRTEPRVLSRPPVTPEPPKVAKPPIIEGWSETELVSVYNAAPVKLLKKGEPLFTDVPKNDSFYVLVDGSIHVVVKLNGQPGRPGFFKRGDCVAPLPQSPGLAYCAETAEESTIIEIPPAIMKHLSDKAQLCIYRVASTSTSKINAYIRTVNGEINIRNLRLSQYILNQNAGRAAAIQSEFVKAFLKDMRRLPMYATDLAVKLLDDNTSVQEVVEGIKLDPNLVGIVLRTVNSAQYGFDKKIESFYHACMILGFNNIYALLMREAAQSTMPITRETTRIHKHSCVISTLAFEIACLAKDQQAQTVSTIGLLHDFGKGVQVVMKTQHRDKADFVDSLDSSKLGAALLREWGIPERICRTVDFQQHPEFMSPDLIAPEYRREVAALHIAHVLEILLLERPIDPIRSIYTPEYMSLLGFGNMTPQVLLQERVLPSLKKNRTRVPPDIHTIVFKATPLNTPANSH